MENIRLRVRPHPSSAPDSPQCQELLIVQEVATLLRCSVDHVRRIPRNELPAAKVGRRVLYHRDDVLSYVRSKIPVQAAAPAQPRFSSTVAPTRARGSSFMDKFNKLRADN